MIQTFFYVNFVDAFVHGEDITILVQKTDTLRVVLSKTGLSFEKDAIKWWLNNSLTWISYHTIEW